MEESKVRVSGSIPEHELVSTFRSIAEHDPPYDKKLSLIEAESYITKTYLKDIEKKEQVVTEDSTSSIEKIRETCICPICTEPYRAPLIGPCGHSMCESCLEKSPVPIKCCVCNQIALPTFWKPNITLRELTEAIHNIKHVSYKNFHHQQTAGDGIWKDISKLTVDDISRIESIEFIRQVERITNFIFRDCLMAAHFGCTAYQASSDEFIKFKRYLHGDQGIIARLKTIHKFQVRIIETEDFDTLEVSGWKLTNASTDTITIYVQKNIVLSKRPRILEPIVSSRDYF